MADFFSTLFGGGAEKEAAAQDRATAALYQNQALPAFQQAYQTGTGALNQAIAGYQPLVNLGKTYSQVAPTLTGALGVGTPAQIAQARQAFQVDPGYQFALDQAQQAAERGFATGGMTNSGNLLGALQKNAVGYANQDYQNWLNNLKGVGQLGLTATQAGAAGQGAGYGGLANLAELNASNQAGIYGNVAQTDIGANNLAAAGEAAGAKNLLGAGLSLATLGLGGNPFGGAGGTNFGSSLLGQTYGGLKNLFGGGGFVGGSTIG